MHIAIRADSSVALGSGHVMRCLTLAECLRSKGAEVSFVCRALAGNVAHLAEKQGFLVCWLDEASAAAWQDDASSIAAILAKEKLTTDWLIVDHYGLDARWEAAMRPYTQHIMAIDDLANRPHACDLLLDANYYNAPATRYTGLVPDNTQLLLGPQYALLRPEFSQAPYRRRNGKIERILIFFGGSDPTHETDKLLTVLAQLPDRPFAADVVVGMANPHKDEIARRCSRLAGVEYFCQIDNMAELMSQADLAIGAGGSSLWERCNLGLPSIVIAVADNQIETSAALASTGAIHYLGFHTEVDAEKISAAIRKLMAEPDTLRFMSRKAREIVPANGTQQVVNAILSYPGKATEKYSHLSSHNILITSASQKIPLLQAVKQAAAKLGDNGKLIAADTDATCLARHFADDFWHMPPLADLADDTLLAALSGRNVRYIIPTRDGELAYWSRKKAWLKQHGIDVMVAEAAAVDTCIDKLAFYQTCRALHIPAIHTTDTIAELPADSYVVKERYGSGACNLGLNLSGQNADRFARGLKQPVFQPYIEGREYSVDAYIDLHGHVKGLICRTRDVIVNGEAKVTTTVDDDDLAGRCTAYIEKLGLYGHIILQLIIDCHGKDRLIECNPRFGGASTLSLAAGLDSFYWFFLEADGRDLADQPFRKNRQRLRQVRFPTNLIEEVDP